ncbi:hypothetical protein ASPZODRAFT_19390 [Penicilliopsis zonata CBS 506.65]|uniref:Major facilitator superfamily (MFS) profile domain-containing protein n=1 Tax=Penicilliopsis zonata CBS 506.65 TaxID=1073090 RepID=A0A1L9S937_9EURO|nr:hypothetical protein ASPZODRAFT_19390 [Penicilliopsis zonata CBS 506.65]OJJ43673.1 hypothetical protein ASPZODRAFT_19390 [Penicilliopsis zonata CBS 506.65]
MVNWFTIRCAVIASVGGYAFGVDSGIIATTLAHESFYIYMFGPTGSNAALLGAIVALYSAGNALGSFFVGPLADAISRRWSISVSGLFATVGGILMCAAQDPAMMIVGRFCAGVSAGINLSIIPVYIAEISPPASRARMLAILGTSIAIGFCIVDWIGYGAAFAVGNAQWRIPLGIQCVGTLAIGIAPIFIPYSPRWLVQKGRVEEAREVLMRLHSSENEAFILNELTIIQQQIDLENEVRHEGMFTQIRDLVSKRYRLRFLIAVCVFVVTNQLSGVYTIQNYQTDFYDLVGYTGNQALLVTGVYGFMGVIGQIINIAVVADRIGRRTTMWVGSFGLAICTAITMAMTATVGSSTAKANTAIAFIFIYSAWYAVFFNTTSSLLVTEIFPFRLRALGFGVASFCGFCVNILLSEVSPLAFDGIGWKYYFVFTISSVLGGLFYIFFLPETKGMNLEEVAAVFGDVVATTYTKDAGDEEKADGQHVEILKA